MNKLRNLFGLCLLALAMMLGNTDVVYAQCPTCPVAPPPIYLPYTFSGSVHLTLSGGCGVEVCYCKRAVGSGFDVTITSITPDAGPACDGLTWANIITLSNQALVTNQTVGSTPPPCSDPVHDTLTVSTGLCWNLSMNTNNPPAYTIANCSEVGWCQTIYAFCEDLGSIEVYPVSSNFIPGNCTTQPPANNEWTLGTCYEVFSGCP